ncbi:hypothetical protein [Saccharopolyspora sp. 5N708]|uniref:hypothetical protein n=1 Tax=Saccharopolyspora sp. 5N708 TaxID=3457424 RepID=UPI003FCF58B0
MLASRSSWCRCLGIAGPEWGGCRVAQQHVLPPQRTFLRTGARLQASAAALQHAWQGAERHLHGGGRDLLRSRQAAALLACARWSGGSRRDRAR